MSGTIVYENFKWNNPSIKKFYSHHEASLRESLNVQKDEFVMDYGCGDGSFTESLVKADCQPNLFGVDVNEDMVEFAKHNSTSSHPVINYSIGNIMDNCNWKFDMQEMDKVFSVNVMPYIQDYKTFLKKIYNLLNAGGLFGTMFPVGRPYALAVDLGNTVKWRHYNRKELNAPGMADWVCKEVPELPPINKELEACGFNLVEYKIQSSSLEFESIHDFYEYLIAVNPTLGNVPDELHDDLIQDMDALAPTYIKGDFLNNMEPFEHKWFSCRFVAEKPITKTIIHLF